MLKTEGDCAYFETQVPLKQSRQSNHLRDQTQIGDSVRIILINNWKVNV